jgi:hypothetical protein
MRAKKIVFISNEVAGEQYLKMIAATAPSNQVFSQ